MRVGGQFQFALQGHGFKTAEKLSLWLRLFCARLGFHGSVTAGIRETMPDRLRYTIDCCLCPLSPVRTAGSEALCLKACFNPCTCWSSSLSRCWCLARENCPS